jgi:acetamidase/formamidase
MALDERRDVRVVRSGEKVSFPVAWHGAVLDLGRPLADGDGRECQIDCVWAIRG